MGQSPSDRVNATRAWLAHLKACEGCQAVAVKTAGAARCEAGRKLRLAVMVLQPPPRE